MTVDSLDIHDGERLVKGHASVAIVPAALATLGLGGGHVSGRELLTTLVGWEVALRAGRALPPPPATITPRVPGARSAAPRSPPGGWGWLRRRPATPWALPSTTARNRR